MPDNLLFLSIPELGRRLRAGEVSSVGLATLALQRLETHGRRLNAVAAILEERALAEAAQADEELRSGRDRGPLHGIPYGAKDLIAAVGAPTEWGSPAHKGQDLPWDATVVKRLKNAGAVLVAKLAMVSLAGGGGYRYASASSTGPGHNPWNPDTWAGGSSSGSGAAVSAGLVPFAIGSETWGSIVVPAAFCGVTGLRPTYGRVPRTGAMALSWTLDKVGPITRTPEDAGLVLAAIAGRDAQDPSSLPGKWRVVRTKRTPFKVGVVREDWGRGDQKVKEAFEAALKALETAGMRLVDVKLPDLPFVEVPATIVTVEGSAAFKNLIRGPKLKMLLDAEQRAGLVAGLALSGADYLHAMQLRPRLQRAMAALFKEVDILISQSLMNVAPPIEANLDTYFSGGGGLQAAGNATGLPCITVPMGYGEGGLPCGLQIVADAGHENTVLDAATVFQAFTRWHLDRPPGF